MQALDFKSFARLTGLLLVLLVPFAGVDRGSVHTSFQGATVEACGDSATDCKSPVKYLGDNKGCSCFACEYGKKTQRVLCSNNEAEKNKFRALLPKRKG
jgi:hypothetical protein